MNIRNLLSGRNHGVLNSATAKHSADISRWSEIWHGGGDWRYTRKGGMNGGTRRVASLGAAQAVCAELSRLCFTEGSTLCCADDDTEKFLAQVLEQNSFAQRFPEFLELVFALGSGAVRVYYDDGIKLDFVSAENFVPTKWDSRDITGAAFASQITQDGKSYILAHTQEMNGDCCDIENRLYSDSGAPAELKRVMPGLPEKCSIEGLSRPLFVCFSVRSGEPDCPALGRSVFADAVDTLKSLDIIFDSLNREFVLGRKRIIVPTYAVRGEYDRNGDIKRYFDVNDEVFEALSTSDTEDLKISDNTSELRITEHLDALSALLDMLCMQVGLSEGALSYKDGSIRTAAEVISRNSRTYRTQAFYRKMITDNLARVVANICTLGKMAGLLPDGASDSVSAVYGDGIAEDDSTRTDRALKLYSAGVISRRRAISQIYGVSAEEAEKMERTDFNEQ